MLRSQKQPFAILSAVGRPRTGKSTILGRAFLRGGPARTSSRLVRTPPPPSSAAGPGGGEAESSAPARKPRTLRSLSPSGATRRRAVEASNARTAAAAVSVTGRPSGGREECFTVYD